MVVLVDFFFVLLPLPLPLVVVSIAFSLPVTMPFVAKSLYFNSSSSHRCCNVYSNSCASCCLYPRMSGFNFHTSPNIACKKQDKKTLETLIEYLIVHVAPRLQDVV